MKINRKTILVFATAFLALILVIFGIKACRKSDNKETAQETAAVETEAQETEKSSGEETNAAASETPSSEAAENTAEGNTAEGNTAAGNTAAGDGNGETEAADTTSAVVIDNGSQDGSGITPGIILGENFTFDTGEAEVTDANSKKVSIPCKMDDDLIVTKFAGYNGVFIEDGSDRDIQGVAAIAVKNAGTSNIEYTEITLEQDNETYVFQLSVLPAGAQAVVMEANGKGYAEGTLKSVSCSNGLIDSYPMSEDKVQVTDNGDGTLTITNISGAEIPCVRLFYKYVMNDSLYVGGIAYTAKLNNLAAGDSKTVNPSHYSAGNSKVVMVRTYDAAQ